MDKTRKSKKNFDVDQFAKAGDKFKQDSDNLELYMISCKCQTKENFDPNKKCMCTCSI